MTEEVKCTYCKSTIQGVPSYGINTKLPYCSNSHIVECNRAFGRRAGLLRVENWKAVEVKI